MCKRNHATHHQASRTDTRAWDTVGISITKDIVFDEGPHPISPGNTPGERIRWARYKKNFTIKDLSEATDISEAFISYVENGHAACSITTARKISVALEEPVWFIACLEDLPTDTLAQRIRKYRLYLGLTKREFAAHIGVHEKTVKLWEDGCSVPSKAKQILTDSFNI